MNNTLSSATIKLNLPLGIKKNTQKEAARIGISLQDFIRMLLATYFSRSESISCISRDKILWLKAKKEIKAGEYRKITNSKELKEYLSNL